MTPAISPVNDYQRTHFMNVILVMSTFSDATVARTIARTLVEEQLAACANLVPGAESIYWWKGVIESSTETIGFFKTTDTLYLEVRLKELHPSELPEIVSIQLHGGLQAYLDWVAENTAD